MEISRLKNSKFIRKDIYRNRIDLSLKKDKYGEVIPKKAQFLFFN